MNNDIAYECVPSALYNTYGIKKENSYDYLHSIHKGGLNYVKSCLNKNDKYDYSQIENKTINYINPYDKEIKDSEKMIQDIINQLNMLLIMTLMLIPLMTLRMIELKMK
jgi:esterase/lipase